MAGVAFQTGKLIRYAMTATKYTLHALRRRKKNWRGMYNNDTGEYILCDWLIDADWFEDGDGFLFIVPRPEVVAEIDGPDGAMIDELNAACRDHEQITDADCDRLGLVRVDDALKRFDPETGYYHA